MKSRYYPRDWQEFPVYHRSSSRIRHYYYFKFNILFGQAWVINEIIGLWYSLNRDYRTIYKVSSFNKPSQSLKAKIKIKINLKLKRGRLRLKTFPIPIRKRQFKINKSKYFIIIIKIYFRSPFDLLEPRNYKYVSQLRFIPFSSVEFL